MFHSRAYDAQWGCNKCPITLQTNLLIEQRKSQRKHHSTPLFSQKTVCSFNSSQVPKWPYRRFSHIELFLNVQRLANFYLKNAACNSNLTPYVQRLNNWREKPRIERYTISSIVNFALSCLCDIRKFLLSLASLLSTPFRGKVIS